MPLDSEDFDQLSILQVAEKLGIEVKRNVARCFMHNDNTPSLSFNEKKGLYFCHGCGKGGNIFTLVQNHQKLSKTETKNWLQDAFLFGRYPIPFSQNKPRFTNPPIISNAKPDSEVYEWIFARLSLSDKGQAYLQSRKITSETIELFGIKDLTNAEGLFAELIKTWGKDRLMKCGLYKEDDPTNPVNWRGHILLFPFYNNDNKIVYIQGRRLDTDDRNKYVNLHSLSKPAYNLSCVKDMQRGESLFLCEGIFDALTMHQLGHRCVAILGASGFTSEMAKFFLPYQINVVPDNDKMGAQFFESVRKEFLAVGKTVRKRPVPQGSKDINESYVKGNH